MASLFGRLGTQAMKYSFELSITSLHMSIPLTTPMCVKWTRGPRTATNQPVPGVAGTYEWPQGKPMQIVATMYLKKQKYQSKMSKLTVKQLMGKELKSVGQCEIDLADFCGSAEQTRPLTLKLNKCTDKKAFLVCTIKSKWLKQLQAGDTDDTASQMSGASSVDARSESAMPQQGRPHDVANLADLDGMEEEADEGDEEGGPDAFSPSSGATRPAGAAAAAAAVSPREQSHSSSIHSPLFRSPESGSLGPIAIMHPSSSPPQSSVGSQAALIDTLQAKVSELTQEVNSERAAAAASASKASTLAAQLSQLTEAHELLQRDLDDAEADADRATVKLRADLATAQAELEKSSAERAQLVQRLEQQLQETTTENEQLRTRLANAEAETRTHLVAAASSPSQESNAEAVAAATALQSKLTETLDRERVSFDKQLKELRAQLEEAKRATAEAEARLAAQEAKARDAAAEATRELAARDAEVERLEKTLADKDQQLSAAADAARHTDNQLIDARRNEKEHAAELAALQASFVTEIARRERAEAAAEADAQHVQDLKTQLKKQEMAAEAEAKAARAALAAEREKAASELADLRARMQREQEALQSSSSSSSPAAVSSGAGGDAALAEKDAQIASLTAKMEEYMSRILAVEEERTQLAAECAQLESALSKHKEDELVALEERYAEAGRFKALIREQESAADEASKAARDKERDAKEHKRLADKLNKELAEKSRTIEAAQAQAEALTAKLAKASDDAKKFRALGEQGSARIRELEEQLTASNEERDALKAQLTEKDAELERASKRRTEAEQEFETERAALKKQIEEASSGVAASASPTGASDDASADLAHTQSLLQKRTTEVNELETALREQRMRVRELEEFEERCGSLTRQLRDAETSWSKKIEVLSREKMEAAQELALLKEKRERDRQRAFERDEKEKEARVQSMQQVSELTALQATLQRDLDVANARISELQDSIAAKQSKISEQQDKLNSLTRSADTIGREHSELREEVAALTQRLDTQAKAAATALAKGDADKATAVEDLRRLREEHEALLARRLVFERIDGATLAAAKAAAKDKAHLVQLDALLQKIEFYEEQLELADESMLQAKQAWMASAQVLQAQVEEHEQTLRQVRADLSSALESKGMDATKMANLEAKLKKAEKDKSKLSELMSRFEVELTAKKVELAAALDQLSTQEYDNERLRAQLSKQIKLCEGHVAELNKQRSG